MLLIDSQEAGRRARAAAAFAGLSRNYKMLAEKSGLSLATVRRVMSPTKSRGGSIEELWAIADACEVPRRFMDNGWAALENDRVAQLEGAVNELRGAQGLPPLPGALGSFAQEPKSGDERPGQSQTQVEGDSS